MYLAEEALVVNRDVCEALRHLAGGSLPLALAHATLDTQHAVGVAIKRWAASGAEASAETKKLEVRATEEIQKLKRRRLEVQSLSAAETAAKVAADLATAGSVFANS